jgi:hypothetical protein
VEARIKSLIGFHIVAFVVANAARFGHVGPDAASVLIFRAFLLAEAALLGLWSGLGRCPWPIRVCTVVPILLVLWGTALAEQGGLTARDAVALGLLIGLRCAAGSLVVSALQFGMARLSLRRVSDVPSRKGFQFSLSQILIAMAVVAVALTVGKVTRDMGGAGTWMRILAMLLVITPCNALIDLATLWGALGTGHPLLRLSAVVPLAFAVGLASAFGITSHVDWQQFLLWSRLTGTTAIIIAATLLVVRSAGWRLCSGNEQSECSEEIGA